MEIKFKNVKTNEEKVFTNEKDEKQFEKSLFPFILLNFAKANPQLNLEKCMYEFEKNFDKNWNKYSDEWKITCMSFDVEDIFNCNSEINNQEYPKLNTNSKKQNQKSKSVGNGEGSLYRSEKLNCWIYQYYDTSGKRQTMRQKKNETTKDFKIRVTQVKNSLNTGTYIEKNSKTLGEILEEILDYKFTTNKIGERTYNRTKDTINLIKKSEINIYDMPIQKITKEHLKSLFRDITKYSNSTIDKIFQLTHKAFKKALSKKLILDDPFIDEDEIFKPKSIKADKTIEALTINEHKKLLRVLQTSEKDSYYKNIILLQLYTGMRIGEVLALNRSTDLNFETETISVTKTVTKDMNNKLIISNKTKTFDKNKNANRILKMNSSIVKILKEQLLTPANVDNLLFYNNGIVSSINVNDYLYRINAKYNICKHLSSHVFRHTYATRCIESGMSAKVLQKKLGHANISTTLDTYASVFSKFENTEDEKYNSYIKKEGLLINF